jgi:hypothetical protein
MAGVKQTRYLIALCAEFYPDENNRLRIFSSAPGLFLAGNDHDAVWRDLGPALQKLLLHNDQWPDLSKSEQE